jgi:hypothetical protein
MCQRRIRGRASRHDSRLFRLVLVGLQVVHDFRDGIANAHHAIVIQKSAIGVGLGELQGFHQDFLIIGMKRLFLEELFRLLGGLDRIPREHSLVDQFRRRQRRPVAQHHIEKFQTVHVPSQYDEANAQRRGQNESDRPPQPRPKGRRGDDRDRREAGIMAA